MLSSRAFARRFFSATSLRQYPFLKSLGLAETNAGVYRRGEWVNGRGAVKESVSPHSNEGILSTHMGNQEDYNECVTAMQEEKARWMALPMPARGEIVRQIGERLRVHKDALGSLISLEVGKIKTEGDGEVQEYIDICDMAVGMSRTIGGKVIPSERPEHMMIEQWNPIGSMGVISAFNFPCAVSGWNTAIGLICGNTIIWKGHEETNLVSVAVAKIVTDVLKEHGFNSVFTLCQGTGKDVGEHFLHDKRLGLVSFTGSTHTGRHAATTVNARFGKTLLELGGNNAAIVMEDADLDLVLRGSVFAAAGTCGQRCTSLRRMLVQENVFDGLAERMVKAYSTIKIGDPLDPNSLVGPLKTQTQMDIFKAGIETAKKQGGKVLCGGDVIEGMAGNYVQPTIIEIGADAPILQHELFVPILYMIRFKTLDEAIAMNNSVPQGLSSALFTKDISNYSKWIGPNGSDCGIVNCNIGTSGAEIGGAFGGEKETGGGRESGSDAWKQYMRRSTCTVNYGATLPLAQGVKFDI